MKTRSEEGIINLRDQADIRARRPLLVAHRGGVIAANAPENSLAAIQLAAIHGYDMVELDVREARDQEPVLFHGLGGSGLLVDCGIERAIENFTSAELVEVRYRASTEHIATLAQALTLCESLGLGVMLDIKTGAPSRDLLERMAELLEKHCLGSATVIISHHSLAQEILADQVITMVSWEDYQRVMEREAVSLHGQFWFGWAIMLPERAVEALQRNGAFVIPSMNTFHYPAHARHALARQDAKRLLAAGVDGFQIDSVYEEFFL